MFVIEGEELSVVKLLVIPGEGLAMGAVQMALPSPCGGAQERAAQWDQSSFCGVRLNVSVENIGKNWAWAKLPLLPLAT